MLVQSKRNKHAAPTFSEVRPRRDCGVNITPIGSLVRIDLVEVAARVDPFFVTALWGASAAASRGVLIAAARSARLMWARFHTIWLRTVKRRA